jgi:hypothetical protein
MVFSAEQQLSEAYRTVADRHYNEYEIRQMCTTFAGWCSGHIEALRPLMEQYGGHKVAGPRQLRSGLFHGSRAGSLGLLHDLQDLGVLANATRTQWTILHQAGLAVHDQALVQLADDVGDDIDRQDSWLCTHIKEAAPQAVTMPPNPADEAQAWVRTSTTPSPAT